MSASYHNDISRVSNSMMSLLKDNPRLFYNRYILGEQTEPTTAMQFGSLLHTAVLEPHKIDSQYIVAPKVDRRTKDGKAAWDEFLLAADGKQVVTPDDMNLAMMLAQNVNIHNQFAWYAARLHECVIEDPIAFEFDGHECRCKPDLVHLQTRVCWDLKTTKSVKPWMFRRSILDFGYHRQAAFYLEALRHQQFVDFRFLFIAVETMQPYSVAVFELDRELILQGEEELRMLLDQYKHRLAADDWDAEHTKGINSVSLPKFYDSFIYEYERVDNE